MILALAQINPTVGDLAANARLIAEYAVRARNQNADLVVFPELAICGYPPKDLLLADGFVAACEAAVREIAVKAPAGLTIIVGTPLASPHGLRNALAVCRDGAVVATYAKRLLPTYDVFDEDRYFTPGTEPVVRTRMAAVPPKTSLAVRRIGRTCTTPGCVRAAESLASRCKCATARGDLSSSGPSTLRATCRSSCVSSAR